MSLDEKFELINDFESQIGSVSSAYPIFIHAVLSSIDIKTLIEIQLNSERLKSSRIQSNVIKRLSSYLNTEPLFDFLFQKLNEADYKQRTTLRIFLRALVPNMSHNNLIAYFEFFVNTRYVHDFNDALSCSHLIWDSDLEVAFYEKFLELGDLRILETWIKNSEKSVLASKAQEIWQKVPQRFKLAIIKKIGSTFYASLVFTKDVDISMYFYLATTFTRELIISDEDIDRFIKQADPKMLPFTVLTVSKLGAWEKVEQSVKNLLNDPDKPFQDFMPYYYSTKSPNNA